MKEDVLLVTSFFDARLAVSPQLCEEIARVATFVDDSLNHVTDVSVMVLIIRHQKLLLTDVEDEGNVSDQLEAETDLTGVDKGPVFRLEVVTHAKRSLDNSPGHVLHYFIIFLKLALSEIWFIRTDQ